MKVTVFIIFLIFLLIGFNKYVLNAQNARVEVPARFQYRGLIETHNGVTFIVLQDTKSNSGNQCFLMGTLDTINDVVPSKSVAFMQLPLAACQ